MYDKLEELRDFISDLEIEDRDKNYMLNIISGLERELEIQDGAYEYLSDEDNY